MPISLRWVFTENCAGKHLKSSNVYAFFIWAKLEPHGWSQLNVTGPWWSQAMTRKKCAFYRSLTQPRVSERSHEGSKRLSKAWSSRNLTRKHHLLSFAPGPSHICTSHETASCWSYSVPSGCHTWEGLSKAGCLTEVKPLHKALSTV